MKNYKLLFIIVLFLTIISPLAAQSQAGEKADIRLIIQFHNKKIYYLNQRELFLKVTLINDGKETFRFNIAKNKYFNLDFEVFTPTNLQLKHSQKFIIERNTNQPAFFRELTLEPGEEYGFIVELNDFVLVDQSGMLIIQAKFFPELQMGNRPLSIVSNKLMVNIRPPLLMPEMQSLIEQETGKVLERQPLPPDEVVAYMINARQRGQWEKFYLYLNLEKLYINDTNQALRYKLSTETERIFLLEDYKKRLMEDKVDQEILVIPVRFDIEKTTYTNLQATVIVIERFAYRDFTEIKKYTYSLERSDRFWLITGYVVQTIGTE